MAALNQFRSLVQGLVQQGIQICGDLTETVTYISSPVAAYDTVTGQTTVTGTTYTFQAIFGRFGQNEVDNKVAVSTDAKLTVAFLDLPVEPRENDTMTINGRPWKTMRTIGSPAQSVWTIHIRVA